MERCKNVFEAILKYGNDEDWLPEMKTEFDATDAPAGSPEKIEILRKRLELGLPLWHEEDRYDYNGLTLRFPDIRCVYWAGGNPFHHHQNLPRLRRALARVDTVVVHDPYWTAMAKIINTPATEISNTQCVVLKAMVEHYEHKFVEFYGTAAIVALRTALIEFPNRAPEKSASVNSLKVLAQLLKRESGGSLG